MAFRAQRNSTYGLEGICVTCVNPSGPQQSFWGDWPVKCNRKPVCVILKSFVSLGHVTLNPSMLVAHHQFDVVIYSEIISDPRWLPPALLQACATCNKHLRWGRQSLSLACTQILGLWCVWAVELTSREKSTNIFWLKQHERIKLAQPTKMTWPRFFGPTDYMRW
jgi:hypothetical protein